MDTDGRAVFPILVIGGVVIGCTHALLPDDPPKPKQHEMTKKVKKCQIVIVFGHNYGDPYEFEFGECSAGGFVGCFPKDSNEPIEKQHRIPGAPVHDKGMVCLPEDFVPTPDAPNKLGMGDWRRMQADPDQDFRVQLDKVIEGARRKAAALCKEHCCDKIQILGYRRARPVLDRNVPESVEMPCYCPLKSDRGN